MTGQVLNTDGGITIWRMPATAWLVSEGMFSGAGLPFRRPRAERRGCAAFRLFCGPESVRVTHTYTANRSILVVRSSLYPAPATIRTSGTLGAGGSFLLTLMEWRNRASHLGSLHTSGPRH